MLCPKCSTNAGVRDSRQVEHYRRRNYACPKCRFRFSTVEVHATLTGGKDAYQTLTELLLTRCNNQTLINELTKRLEGA
jgi:hypothetical protein